MTAAVMGEHAGNDSPSLSPEKIYSIVDTVPTIAKLATLAVLDHTPDEFVSGRIISQRLESIQGTQTAWRFSKESPTTAYAYCEDLFARFGLVELGEAPGYQGVARGARITEDGSDLWPAIAGAYLTWQEEYPDIPISDVIGFSQQALLTGQSSRIRVLEYLQSHARSKVGVMEIQKALDINVTTASNTIGELSRIGLVAYQSQHPRPQERSFVIKGPVDVLQDSKEMMTNELRSAVEFLEDAGYEAGTIISLPELVTMAQKVLPDADPRILWNNLRAWLDNTDRRKSGQFLEEIKPVGEKSKERLASIVPVKEEAVADLLNRRDLLANDPDYRNEMSVAGHKFMRSKSQVRTAMRRAKAETKQPTTDFIQWEQTLLQVLPIDGSYLDDLYNATLSKADVKISWKGFVKRVRGFEHLLKVVDRRDKNGILIKPYVEWRQKSFSADWQEKGRCHQPHIDPEIFSPNESDSKDIQRRKIAEAIFHCLRCDVRQACLVDAVVNEQTSIIQGGLTPTQLKAMSPTQRQTLLRVTSID